MNPELVQRTRYLLRTRFRHAQSRPDALFLSACRQLYSWLNTHPIMSAHLQHLKQIMAPGAAKVHKILADLQTGVISYESEERYLADTLEEHASVCLAILEVLATDQVPAHDKLFLCSLRAYLDDEERMVTTEAIQVIRDVALDGLFEYLDEHLDSRNVVMMLLQKYKQRCEWFRRAALRQLALTGHEGQTGEPALARDLYEYLLDQSVEFFVESRSGTGEADLVMREPGGRYIVVDAKVSKGFRPAFRN